jgi:hypothetical protein
MRQVAKYYAILGKQTFNPLDLPDLALWLDASDTATITASSGSVSQWDDKGPGGNDATQAIATNQPTTGSRTQNGLNVIDWDGSNDKLATGIVISSLRTNKAFTAAMVVKSDRTNANDPLLAAAGPNAGSFDFTSGFVIGRNSTNLELTIGNGSTMGGDYRVARFANSSTSPMILAARVSAADNSRSMQVNGVGQSLTDVDGTLATSNFLVNGSGSHGIAVGNRTYTNLPFDGWIGEVLVYAASLSDDDLADVTTYLRNKWGTP